MKVAFWSNVRGASGATSNLACLSIMGAMDKIRKTVVFENHYNLNNLENAYVGPGNRNMIKEECFYFNKLGLDYLMKQLHSNIQNENMVTSSAIPLMNKQIYYIPQSHIANKDFLEYELNQVIHSLFVYLEAFGDVVYVDTAVSEHLSTKVILNEADLVVVNLNQNPQVLSNFFENYSSIRSKAVYLIGNYNHYSRFNLKNIERKFHIDKSKIAVIPYNVEFADALSEGTIIQFLSRNYGCTKNDNNYYFMNQVRNAMSMLEKNMHKIETEKVID